MSAKNHAKSGAKAMRNEKASGATAALRALNAAGVPYELIEYEHSEIMEHGFALDTVAVLGLDPNTVFKTLMVEADGEPAVAVVPASGHLNLKRFAAVLGAKRAEMMDPEKAERITGYIKGGISPLGQRRKFVTVIDESARHLPEMVISGGKRSLSVRLAPLDLARLVGAAASADIAGKGRTTSGGEKRAGGAAEPKAPSAGMRHEQLACEAGSAAELGADYASGADSRGNGAVQFAAIADAGAAH